jgi:hypothetical protein
VSAREVADHRGIVEQGERLIRAVAAPNLGQLTHAADELVSACWGVAALPGLRAHESSRKDVLTPAKEGAEQPYLVGRRPGIRHLDGTGRTYVDLWLGIGRSYLCSKGGEAMPRLVLLGFKCGQQSLLLRDGIAYRTAVHRLSG